MKNSKIKKFFEYVQMAEPKVKPGVKPTTTPRPTRPGITPKQRPGVKERPKADYKEIYDKLMSNMTPLDMEKIKNYYDEKNQ